MALIIGVKCLGVFLVFSGCLILRVVAVAWAVAFWFLDVRM
jgi:hypothetical protein